MRHREYEDTLKKACEESLIFLKEFLIDDRLQVENENIIILPWCIVNLLFPENNDFYAIDDNQKFVSIDSLSTSSYDVYNTFIDNTKDLRNLIHRNGGDDNTYHMALWYLILHLQNESGCATEARCDFPYLSYYKYLLKRQILDLLPYVDWQFLELRTKNKLNQLKIEIQIKNPSVYSILAKNESHIRMAASSWYVAKILRLMSALVLICLIILAGLWICQHYFSNSELNQNFFLQELIKLFAQNQQKPILAHVIIACIAPILVLIGSCYITHQVIKFIHYQRLREIYYALKVYHECFFKTHSEFSNKT